MKIASRAWEIFNRSIRDYHRLDDVDQPCRNPYPPDTLDHLLYRKNWIDTVQWHLEDIIRDPDIDPVKALEIKRRIDRSNQERTDTVEYIDSYFLDYFKDVQPRPDAKINTESPAWALDRLSILALKLYHMDEERKRKDLSPQKKAEVEEKYRILTEQYRDLSTAIDELLEEIARGKKYMKVYRQMKMYNDPELNPVLYGKNRR
ncbi:MAG: DUF4254 domain-containing protein [Chlorobi bacterium]|nr:DUF4254 domain-containing protein [Chlorobiota bacterium]